jgi:hypothetical protein
MRRDVRMHRGRVVIVVIRIDMRVQEERGHSATLNGERQPECEDAADHAAILPQNQLALSEAFLNAEGQPSLRQFSPMYTRRVTSAARERPARTIPHGPRKISLCSSAVIANLAVAAGGPLAFFLPTGWSSVMCSEQLSLRSS